MSDPRPTKTRTQVLHQHFCSACYSFPATRQKVRGWWRCADSPCMRPEGSLCKTHREKLLAAGFGVAR
jgi:hypothetical protein